ncbi:MAG: hypothetical protein WA777_12675 [Rhodanobacter sp.]
MTSVFSGTWILDAPPGVDPSLIAMARKLAGQLVQRRADSGIQVLQRILNMPDGSVIRGLLNGTMPVVQITTPATIESQQISATTMWIPRGFVVYPAWSGSPFGVGVPIIPDASAGPYDAANLAPGLDPSRWTAGGVWGEVLVSADISAGYPDPFAIPVPLCYYPSKGPVYQGAVNADAAMPIGAWQSYRLELAPFVQHYPDENPANQQALFEGANVARAGAGAQAATLRLRGYARIAEIDASLMSVNGTVLPSSTAYPPTYQNPYDRLTKEGYTSDWIVGPFTGFTRADMYSAYELFAEAPSAGAAIGAWNTPDSPLTANFGRSALVDVGYRGGYYALTIVDNDRWIHAGNMSWQSSDTAIPPISWHGFASVNLAWETYPASWGSAEAPLSPLYAFTDAVGDCWLTYPRSTTPTSSDIEPAMGRHVFSRGRAIALAPEGALVWGACVLANTTAGSGGALSDRLVLLAHHPADQPADYTHNGWTRYLRVWWADIPQRALRLDPQQVICGTDSTDRLAWRGGTLIDMGAMPAPSTGGVIAPGVCSSLKYASQWRFSEDGSRAACLRDFAPYADYAQLDTGGQSQPNGMEGRAVELVFAIAGADTNITTVWHDYTGNPLLPSHTVGSVTAWRAVAQAVDYAADNSLLFAYVANTNEAREAPGIIDTYYLGVGPASVQWYSDLQSRVQYAVAFATASQNFAPSDVLIADVRRAAFAVAGMRPEYVVSADGGISGENPEWQQCWPFTTSAAHGVRMFKDGEQISERWYPIPDGIVVCPIFSCTIPEEGYSNFLTWLPPAASGCVQVHWAQRFGEWVFSYQLSPVPQCCRVLGSHPPPAPPYNNCGCWVSSYDMTNNAAWMTFAELNPRGGYAMASVPLPDNDWLIFSKVA